MNKDQRSAGADEPRTPDRQPFRVRLPGFIGEEEVGLGDVIKRATAAIGFKPCGGCASRAEALNRQFVFSPWAKQ